MTETVMRTWHEGSLAGCDLETTSPDPEVARIVTASVLTRCPGIHNGDGRWLLNPGINIPAEATAIHGITTETAQQVGLDPAIALPEIAGALTRILDDRISLVIYNAPYDLTVLDRETSRYGLVPFGELLTDAMIVDPFVLDKHLDPYRRGKRTLAAVCDHYGITLADAHNSDDDTLAAMRLAWKIAARNPAIAEMDPAALHTMQTKAKANQAASYQDYLRRQGKTEAIDGSWPYRKTAS